MGELSKKIGQHGEKVVLNFLKTIGWISPSDGESIPCCNPDAHKRKEGTPRTTHGIDLFYSYKSNLEDFCLENILVSVKYSMSPYDSPPDSSFKKHFKDIAQTVECFSKSSLRNESNKSYEYSGIRKSNDIGVLFWLTNDVDSDQDIVSKISNVSLDRSLEFGRIQVVDSARASFIYNTVKFASSYKGDSEAYFHYAFSSSNYTDPHIEKYGKTLPVEYLSSPIIPIRIIDTKSRKQIFLISCNESYNENAMRRLLNFASDVCQEFSDDFVFLFSRYDELIDRPSVNSAVRSLGERSNRFNVSVHSCKDDFRGLINE